MDRGEFKAFLDAEIESLRDEIRRPGWTRWALTGALAALVWVLISLIEQGDYSVEAVTSLLLVISFLMYSYALIAALVSPGLPSQRPKARIISTHEISGSMPVIILIVVQLAFLTAVIQHLSMELGGVATRISLAAISLLWFSALGMLAIVATRFPMPLNPRHRVNIVILLIGIVLMLLSAWYHVRFLWISPGGATACDIRLALVIAAIFYLFAKLITVPGGAITLDVLTTIRREFLRERIELETAIQQVDIALAGMRASDLLEGYIAKVLSLYRDASAEFSKAMSCLDQLEKWHSETAEKPTAGQSSFGRPTLIGIAASTNRLRSIISIDIPRAYRPIRLRVAVFTSMGFLKAPEDFLSLDDRLRAAQANLVQQADEFTARYDRLYEGVRSVEGQED